MKKITTALLLFPLSVFALEALDEDELSDVTGEGIGATFDNVVLYSGDLGQPDDFEIKLYIDEGNQANSDFIRISELRLNKSGEKAGLPTSGGRFGTYLDPFNIGSLVDIQESFGAKRTFTALYTAFPASDLTQAERSFLTYGQSSGLGYAPPRPPNGANQQSAVRWGHSQHASLPEGFFLAPRETGTVGNGDKRFTTDNLSFALNTNGNLSDGNNDGINDGVASGQMSNLDNVFTSFKKSQEEFERSLDQATDKFDLHLRVDSVTDVNRNAGFDEQFFATLDVEGMRLYGTETHIWARDFSEFGSNSGLAIAATTGLVADSIRINADPKGALGSSLSLDGVDMYLPLGTVNQPLTISTVPFKQQKRYNWKTTPHRDGNGAEQATLDNYQSNWTIGGKPIYDSDDDFSTQLRIEITALPQLAGQAEQGNITIRQLSFGDPNDPEVITGKEDVYLRNDAGIIVGKIDDVEHRAFVPRTVTYNEQAKIWNDNPANVNNQVPYIPNENVIELRGIEIQRLVITTQDLNRVCTECLTQ